MTLGQLRRGPHHASHLLQSFSRRAHSPALSQRRRALQLMGVALASACFRKTSKLKPSPPHITFVCFCQAQSCYFNTGPRSVHATCLNARTFATGHSCHSNYHQERKVHSWTAVALHFLLSCASRNKSTKLFPLISLMLSLIRVFGLPLFLFQYTDPTSKSFSSKSLLRTWPMNDIFSCWWLSRVSLCSWCFPISMYWSSCPSNLFGVAAGSTIVRMLQSFSYLRFWAASTLNRTWQLRRLKIEVVLFGFLWDSFVFPNVDERNHCISCNAQSSSYLLRIVMIVREHGAKIHSLLHSQCFRRSLVYSCHQLLCLS